MNLKQTGRSMIEMLGVLAIIGVLSIAGVSMYRASVNKHKANEIAHDANLIATLILTTNQMESLEVDSELSFSEYKNNKSGYTFTSYKETSDIFSVNVLNVPKGICKKILTGPPITDLNIGVNQETYSDVLHNSECDKDNTINFYFDTAHKVKCGGRICYGGRICQNSECTCPPHKTLQGETCVCSPEYPLDCGDANCYAECTGDGQFDCTYRQCVCPEATHEMQLVNNKCVCPTGTEEWADGKCHKRSCSGGTTGNEDWTCYIDDKRCGYECTENGLTCKHGLCDAGACTSGKTHAYHTGSNLYGCRNTDGSTCMRDYTASKTIFCYLRDSDTTPCGGNCPSFTPSGCNYGLCDPSQCQEGTHFGKMTINFGYSNLSGCWKDDGSLQCSKGIGSAGLTCATSDNVICGKNCAYNGNCEIDMCPKENCPDYQMYDEQTGTCVNVCPTGTTYQKGDSRSLCVRNSDGAYCGLGTSDSGLRCWLANSHSCGIGCNLDATNCQLGVCDPICPSGLTLRNIYSVYGGCYDDNTKIGCYPVTYGAKIICYKNGERCSGDTCTDYYGSGCCQDVLSCPAGMTKTSYNGVVSCYNPVHGTTCELTSDKSCYRQDLRCGYSCNVDATGCTSGKCLETDCNAGQTLVVDNTLWRCQATSITCTDGNCYINGSKCGSDCDSTGFHCAYGVCDADICPNGTYLAKIDTNTYGCKNSTGVACYPDNNKYTCTKAGSVCATNCLTYNENGPVSCATNTCNP